MVIGEGDNIRVGVPATEDNLQMGRAGLYKGGKLLRGNEPDVDRVHNFIQNHQIQAPGPNQSGCLGETEPVLGAGLLQLLGRHLKCKFSAVLGAENLCAKLAEGAYLTGLTALEKLAEKHPLPLAQGTNRQPYGGGGFPLSIPNIKMHISLRFLLHNPGLLFIILNRTRVTYT